MITLGELANAASIRDWALRGRNGVVKVVNRTTFDTMRLGPDQIRVKGYITLAKYLFGLDAQKLERALGLPPAHFAAGAYVFSLSRLPSTSEVDYKYSLAWPDGKIPTPAEYADLIRRRDAAYAGLTAEPSLYPPGGGHIPQWRLNFDRAHPGIPGSLLQHVAGSDRFMRDKPFSPHNRPVKWGGIL